MNRITIEELNEKLEEKYNCEYTILKFETLKKKALFKHNICDREFYSVPNFKKKLQCIYCFPHLKNISPEEYRKLILHITKKEYEVLENYQKNDIKIKHRHVKCGYVFNIRPSSFVSVGTRCPKCAIEKIKKQKSLTHADYLLYLNSLNEKYEPLEDYVNAHTKIAHKHLKCGEVWKTTPNNIKRGNYCPFCSLRENSKGSKKIASFLDKFGIIYKQEFKFQDCKNVRALPFDFAIFIKNEIYGLIEFDGKQHFNIENHRGGEKGFNESKKRDKIKNEYCKDNNLRLLRISYLEEDKIEEILRNFLKL